MGIVLENYFARRRYPAEGRTLAVVDTGYEGFVAVPQRVFESLSLGGPNSTRRRVRTADGRIVTSKSSLSTVHLPDQGTSLDGPVETLAGLDEILVGTSLLSRFRVTLDYCLGGASIQRCRRSGREGIRSWRPKTGGARIPIIEPWKT
jgi:clan AA aspartic protease